MATETTLQLPVAIERAMQASSALEALLPERTAAARSALATLPFPTTRNEEWKYTRTTRLSSEEWQFVDDAASADIRPWLIDGWNAPVAVLINGVFRPDLSQLPASTTLRVMPIGASDGVLAAVAGSGQEENDVFSAMNMAACTGGLAVHASGRTSTDRLHILLLQRGERSLAQPRITVLVEKNASLHTVVTYASLDQEKGWCNAVLEGHVGANANLTIDKLQQGHDQHFCLVREHVRQEKDSRFTINTFTIDGGWVRNDLAIRIDGQHCDTYLTGFYLPRNQQHVDNHTLVDHLHPNCHSNELYKGVLFDRGRGVFNGKVYVRPDAQKTNAYQTNANIMMSDDATMNTKPELEIYADDVKCSHGTTTGQFDERALFYLRARGIGEDAARKMLVSAFIEDVIDRCSSELVRNHVRKELLKRDLLVD